tara:strand:- start:363 stop:1025 length:663 start_codon:yes stop_codon:yes gene_type:complete
MTPIGLKFYYGCMGSGKSENLIDTFQMVKAKAIVLQATGSRGSDDLNESREKDKLVASRNGQSIPCTAIYVDMPSDDLLSLCMGHEWVLVDEAQFLTALQVQTLKHISLAACVQTYGLRSDFRGEWFSGSSALMLNADNIIEIPRVCQVCKYNKATAHFRYTVKDGQLLVDRAGAQVVHKTKASYVSCCSLCNDLYASENEVGNLAKTAASLIEAFSDGT